MNTGDVEVCRPVPWQELIEQAKTVFRMRFHDSPTVASVAPGRVALIGHHTDYNEGYVLPMAIPLYTVIVGAPNGSTKCHVHSQTMERDNDVTIDLSTPLEKGSPHWANYVKGAMAFYQDKVIGFDAVILSTVPLGGGLSSSASLLVATYLFLDGITAPCDSKDSPPVTTSRKDKALQCQKAEHKFADVPCGIMDQFTSMLAKEGQVLLIDCRSQDHYFVPMHEPDLVVVVVNSNVKHQLTGSEYSERRHVCEDAAKSVGVALRDMTYAKYTEIESKLDPVASRRVRHVVCENWRVLRVFETLKNKDFAEAGKMLYDSHKSLRDDFEVSCYELDQLVELSRTVDGVYGCCMTGAGFGGCMVGLCRRASVPLLVNKIKTEFDGKPTFYAFDCPADGAHWLSLTSTKNGPDPAL